MHSFLAKLCETLHLCTDFFSILCIEDKLICQNLCKWTHCTFKQLEDKRSVAKYLLRDVHCQVEQGSEQPDQVEDVPACCRGLGLGDP